MSHITGKVVLVTGCCGTVGSELVRSLLEDGYDPAAVIGLDNNETSLFFIDDLFGDDPRAATCLGDIRDRDRLCQVMQGVDIVFHAAALKHVILCERSPNEAVQTNIEGVRNVIFAAYYCNVEKVIFTSSDKAVNPSNVMGTSKLMGERLMTSAAVEHRSGRTIFASARFGNVLGSNGSVMPIFCKQIAAGGPVTLTDYEMTRFIMTVHQAATLVIESAAVVSGGEVLVTKMPIVRIRDLATVMIRELAPQFGHTPESVELTTIGVKAGEKLYEELMSIEEIERVVELPNYFVILPALGGESESANFPMQNQRLGISEPYVSTSSAAMSEETLRTFLVNHELMTAQPQLSTIPLPTGGPVDRRVNQGLGYARIR